MQYRFLISNEDKNITNTVISNVLKVENEIML